MTDFRGPLPLRDEDFAEVRRKVRGRLERRPIAPIVFRFAVAAAAVIVLAIIFFPRPETPITPRPLTTIHGAPALAGPSVPAKDVARLKPGLHKPERHKPAPKTHSKAEQIVASAGGPPPDSEIVMNIQTADPNVRIVWITQR